MTEDDVLVILEFEEEQFRLGNFEKIFPCINNVEYYNSLFEYPRPNNLLLLRYLNSIDAKNNQHHVSYTPKIDKLK